MLVLVLVLVLSLLLLFSLLLLLAVVVVVVVAVCYCCREMTAPCSPPHLPSHASRVFKTPAGDIITATIAGHVTLLRYDMGFKRSCMVMMLL